MYNSVPETPTAGVKRRATASGTSSEMHVAVAPKQRRIVRPEGEVRLETFVHSNWLRWSFSALSAALLVRLLHAPTLTHICKYMHACTHTYTHTHTHTQSLNQFIGTTPDITHKCTSVSALFLSCNKCIY